MKLAPKIIDLPVIIHKERRINGVPIRPFDRKSSGEWARRRVADGHSFLVANRTIGQKVFSAVFDTVRGIKERIPTRMRLR